MGCGLTTYEWLINTRARSSCNPSLGLSKWFFHQTLANTCNKMDWAQNVTSVDGEKSNFPLFSCFLWFLGLTYYKATGTSLLHLLMWKECVSFLLRNMYSCVFWVLETFVYVFACVCSWEGPSYHHWRIISVLRLLEPHRETGLVLPWILLFLKRHQN